MLNRTECRSFQVAAAAPGLPNFPTESYYKHIDFYRTITLEVLKRFVGERG
jgi:hypothetical protein